MYHNPTTASLSSSSSPAERAMLVIILHHLPKLARKLNGKTLVSGEV